MTPAGTSELAQSLLTQHGFVALFLLLVLEGAMLLYFAPSESLVPAAVVLLASSTIDVVAIILVAVLGATVGQYVLFLVAKRTGREYLLQKRWFRIGEERLDRFDAWFDRWGLVAIPVSNTLLFTRGMLTVPAGLAGMRDRHFVVLSAIGTLSFQAILVGLTLGVLEIVL